jgi:hypothetical protein
MTKINRTAEDVAGSLAMALMAIKQARSLMRHDDGQDWTRLMSLTANMLTYANQAHCEAEDRAVAARAGRNAKRVSAA